jgi:steroid delta-isomerase-like uncharacterized protein
MRTNALILVILVALSSSCATVRGGGAAVDTAPLERLLDEWTSAWSSGDVPRLLALFSDDVHYEDVTFGMAVQGRAALRDFAATVAGAFAELRFEPRARFVSADGTSGVIEWLWRGRQTKDFPGLPATNRPFQVRGVTIVEFRNGRIVRNSDYWDLATYSKQVGLSR